MNSLCGGGDKIANIIIVGLRSEAQDESTSLPYRKPTRQRIKSSGKTRSKHQVLSKCWAGQTHNITVLFTEPKIWIGSRSFIDSLLAIQVGLHRQRGSCFGINRNDPISRVSNMICVCSVIFFSLLFLFREEDLIDFYWLQLNYTFIVFFCYQTIQKQSQHCSLNSVTKTENR